MPPKRKAPAALASSQRKKRTAAKASESGLGSADPAVDETSRIREVSFEDEPVDVDRASQGSAEPLEDQTDEEAGENVVLNDEEAAYFAEYDQNVDNFIQSLSINEFDTAPVKKHQTDPASQYFPNRDLSYIELRPDHATRPLWIWGEGSNAKIIVETFCPAFKDAEIFLINIAEPLSRVALIHEYTITTHSLIAAVAVGYTSEDIISKLDMLTKTAIPESIKQFIYASTHSFGQVRLVLKNGKFMIETSDLSILQQLLRDPFISPLRVNPSEGVTKSAAPKMGALTIPGTKIAAETKQAEKNLTEIRDGAENNDEGDNAEDAKLAAYLDDDDEEEAEEVHSFEIAPHSVQEVSKRCQAIGWPLTEEYDFRNDDVNADLEIDLNPITSIRPYQETALRKMFGNGRAKSGIIVLPCGAGKTLVGITAACTIRKGVVVLCTSAMSVLQWRNEFLKWSNINPKDVAVFTSDHKSVFPGNTGIIITTYTMLTQTRKRSHDAQQVMDFLENREWGLMLLDEVHVTPADIFKRVTYTIKARAKLGLTATLLREDNKIGELNFLIGPKLYEANWQELSAQGHIARVQCAEVWCSMSPEFYMEYIRTKLAHQRTLLYVMNPNKFQACQFLIDYHEKRGDKIIVFSDNVFALHHYARMLNKCYIYGGTTNAERSVILENFQHNPNVNTLFLSKIGDTSLDLPEATCLIQISSHYGSRRQEAQRLGRILRAKRRNDEGFNAFFYSLVSKGTDEMFYSSKRQAFLVDQGYSFKVITHLDGLENTPNLAFSTPRERRELLAEVMKEKAESSRIEDIEGDLFSSASKRNKAKRSAGLLADLSGGQDMAYAEYEKRKKSGRAAERPAVFAKLHRDYKKRKELWETELAAAGQYSKAAGYR